MYGYIGKLLVGLIVGYLAGRLGLSIELSAFGRILPLILFR